LGEGQTQALVPPGIWNGDRFLPVTSAAAESIAHSYYQLPAERTQGGPLVKPAPDKARAYSWIKAPRRNGLPLEVGPLARLAFLHHSVPAGETADLLDDVARNLGGALTGASSIAGRLVARQAEVRILSRRCGELLDQMSPGGPGLLAGVSQTRVTGSGMAEIESPAGALRHRATFDNGSVALWDVIGPSTWNGSPTDESGQAGPIEAALASAGLDLNRKEDRLTASRIVYSFAFSTVDAVH
jgi:Ni,Fe-hydrogenase I large subunit